MNDQLLDLEIGVKIVFIESSDEENIEIGSGFLFYQDSEQGGTRPVIIVSRNAINNSSPLVIAVPCTTYRTGRRIYPSQILISSDCIASISSWANSSSVCKGTFSGAKLV